MVAEEGGVTTAHRQHRHLTPVHPVGGVAAHGHSEEQGQAPPVGSGHAGWGGAFADYLDLSGTVLVGAVEVGEVIPVYLDAGEVEDLTSVAVVDLQDCGPPDDRHAGFAEGEATWVDRLLAVADEEKPVGSGAAEQGAQPYPDQR